MKQHHPLYQTLLDGMARYGAEPAGAVEETLGVPVERIRRHVVLAPWWEPSMFDPACLGRAEYISPVPNAETMVWEVAPPQGEPLTFIKTHIGAPVCTDVALALGLTACEACLFIGSVGALDPAMRLGDIVVPESSVCGDGTSRYLLPGTLAQNDPFGMRAYPDAALNARLIRTAKRIAGKRAWASMWRATSALIRSSPSFPASMKSSLLAATLWRWKRPRPSARRSLPGTAWLRSSA